ncbi:uncharacterized protein PgNI_09149 [Pyricularia grisea]|uniref:Copper transport protein n=1 Tax=Pyricularia grisea TaxID=148305 RepID=A0A6P8ARP0_PYRGI|nr:uncharacterized protein PgNI_09149 [Pyricularia grisea]TLD04778.1 hypothetical protein PgNI_09149 [Pyricularia grisea]
MSHHSSSSDSDMSECKMTMMFNTYTIDACFLTEDWHITNNGMFAATCIGVMLLVVLLEFTRRLGKEYDEFLARQFQRQAAAVGSARQTARDRDPEGRVVLPNPCAPPPPPIPSEYVTFRATALQQFIRALLHALTFGLAYIVMLIAMYYNVILLVMIVLGAGIGKFFCDWMTRTLLVDGVPGVEVSAPGAAKEGASAKGVEEPSVCCG